MKKLILVLLTGMLMVSCEKSVTFNLEESDPLLVVEATIENDQRPVVVLSNSLNYFSEITPQILLNSFVHNAEITISNGVKTHRLKEYSYNVIPSVDLYYYSIDSTNLSTAFTGEFNEAYSLEIKVNGKQYRATTTIPALNKTLDSIWWKKSPNHPDTNKVVIMARITDPPGYGNYIRYYTKTGDGPFLPALNSVFDDQIIDGTTYEIEGERGVDRNESIDIENYSFF